jgi:dolichol-phosphate mannosyltransferase
MRSRGVLFAHDVTLAGYAAALGFLVGFLEGAIKTWNEWGRELDLKDAASSAQITGDLWLLVAVQGLPVPIILCYLLFGSLPPVAVFGHFWLLGLNLFLVAVREALCLAIAPSYDTTGASGKSLFWLSPLADPLAFLRILMDALNQPTQWRGRKYN